MKKGHWAAGVDFGGTNVKVGLVDAAGRVVRTEAFSSSEASRPDTFVKRVGRAVEALSRSVGVRPSRLQGIGVGAPGPVDVQRGMIHFMVNVPGWREVPLGRLLERRLHCPCLVDNDVNLFTLGEWRFGAGRGADALVGMTLGTGVGGGLVFDGVLYRGCRGAAGEVGHMVIDPRGRRCGCGRRGCLEAQVGTAAILNMGAQAIRRQGGLLREGVRRAGGRLTPELISRAAAKGDRHAKAIWTEVGRRLGIGLANLVNLLNPDRIVIGGGIGNAWRWFAPTALSTVRSEAMAVHARAVRIVRAQLGNAAGVVGATVLVWNETC